jgi:hypothetical protein
MPIRRDLQAELESLGPGPADGAWSLVVWVDRAVKTYTSRELVPIGNVFLRAWECVAKSPTPCSMAIYRSEDLRVPGATDFLVLFRSFGVPEEPPFIVGEEQLRDTMKAETEAIRLKNETLDCLQASTSLSLEIELF